MYCALPAGLMEQESLVLELLPETAGYESQDGALRLFSAGGAQLMTFISNSEAGENSDSTAVSEILANLEYLSN